MGTGVTEETYYIHPSAVVDEGASIGDATKLWHNVHVMSSAIIGRQCVLGQNVFVGQNVVIGDFVKVQNNVSLFDGVMCEDHVFIGPSVVFTNVVNPRSQIDRKDEFKKTLICQGASIGANASILCGLKIGRYAFVGAGTMITKPVLPYELHVGNPGTCIGWMSKSGSRLLFNKDGIAKCPMSQDSYKLENGKVSIAE